MAAGPSEIGRIGTRSVRELGRSTASSSVKIPVNGEITIPKESFSFFMENEEKEEEKRGVVFSAPGFLGTFAASRDQK